MNKQSGFTLIELFSILLLIVLSINTSLAFVSHYGFNIYYNLFIIPIVFFFILILPIYLVDVFDKVDNKSLKLLGKFLTTLYIVIILILAIFIPLFLYKNYILLTFNVVSLFPFLFLTIALIFAKK